MTAKIKIWEEKSNLERQESLNDYYKMIIANAIKHKKDEVFWNKDMSQKEIDKTIPYNAKTGATYTGISSIALRCDAQVKNYKEPAFLTMREANLLGGTLKLDINENGEILKTKNGKDKYVDGIKVSYIKEYDFITKKDANGQPLMKPVRDNNGNIKLDENGKEMYREVKEKIFLQTPKLETITLYHISQFNGLKKEKLAKRDMTLLEKYREKIPNMKFDPRGKMERLGLTKEVANSLNNFYNSEIKGQDYKKPISLSQSIKQEIQVSRGR